MIDMLLSPLPTAAAVAATKKRHRKTSCRILPASGFFVGALSAVALPKCNDAPPASPGLLAVRPS